MCARPGNGLNANRVTGSRVSDGIRRRARGLFSVRPFCFVLLFSPPVFDANRARAPAGLRVPAVFCRVFPVYHSPTFPIPRHLTVSPPFVFGSGFFVPWPFFSPPPPPPPPHDSGRRIRKSGAVRVSDAHARRHVFLCSRTSLFPDQFRGKTGVFDIYLHFVCKLNFAARVIDV